MQHVDTLIAYIDELMSKMDSGGQEQINKDISVDYLINSGGNMIEKLLRPLKWHASKKCFLSAMDRETRKVVIDVLNEAQPIMYLGMAFSVIAYLWERAEQASSNKDECLRLLRYMSVLAKHMKTLDVHLDRPKLNQILLFIVKETLMCARQMESKSFCRYIFAPVDAADLENLESELLHLYPDLELQALTAILNRLPIVPGPSQGEYPHDAVGLEEAQNKVIQQLDLQDLSRRVVVIYGVGGIGKTTLATAVVNRLDLSGYSHCRVFIDLDSKHNDPKEMQEQILYDAFRETVKLHNCTQGREKLSEAFGKASKPVFLFIDNAIRQTDLEMLLPIQHLSRLPTKSRILVTTRNLKETNIFEHKDGIQVYSHRVDSLSVPESKRVLCHYALGDKNGSFDRAVNIDNLLQICEGIPLVLKIVGSHLRTDGNTVSACNDVLKYFKEWQQEGFEGGGEDLSESIVDFVYRRLKEPCKQAFLDIAFFFYDWELRKVVDIVGEIQFLELEGAALVTTSSEDKVKCMT